MDDRAIIEALLRQIEMQNKQIEILQREKEELKQENVALKKQVDTFNAAKLPTTPKTEVPKPPAPPKTPEPKKYVENPNKELMKRVPQFAGKLEELLKEYGEYLNDTTRVNKILNSQFYEDIVDYTNSTGWYQRLIDTYNAYIATAPGVQAPAEVVYRTQEVFDNYYEDIYDNFLYQEKEIKKTSKKK